jgi:hypothetical protein
VKHFRIRYEKEEGIGRTLKEINPIIETSQKQWKANFKFRHPGNVLYVV